MVREGIFQRSKSIIHGILKKTLFKLGIQLENIKLLKSLKIQIQSHERSPESELIHILQMNNPLSLIYI